MLEKVENVRSELTTRMDMMNNRLDLLYQNMVRRDEHHKLEQEVVALQERVKRLEKKVAVE